MKILQIITVCTAVISKCVCAKNDGDSGKPYEFGFTIDGEQHRYEKRDANGIIQGEFGFITADGIYHVTTYATDENGSYRVLSMRNVRISDPLDGSGGTYSSKVPASSVQGAGKIPQKPQQQLLTHQQIQQTPVATLQNQISSTAGTTPPNTINRVTQITTKRTPIKFTLQSSTLPSCAGCGYVTEAPSTKKPISQFIQSPNVMYKPPQNQISQISSSLSGELPKTTASPFLISGTTTQLLNVNNNYQPGIYAPNVSQQQQQHRPQNQVSQISSSLSGDLSKTTASPFLISDTTMQLLSVNNNYQPGIYAPNVSQQQQQHRPVESAPQTQVNNHSSQSLTLPSQSTSFIPPQSFPSGLPQISQTANKPPHILPSEPSQAVSSGQISPSQAMFSGQPSPDIPSQFVEPPAFSPQQQQIQSNINAFNQPLSPNLPVGPPQSFQPLNKPLQVSSFEPSQSLSPDNSTLPSPIGPSTFNPFQSGKPPAFSPQQPQIDSNIDSFNPESGSAPLLPIAPVPGLPHVQNDTIQLPVNTFARPPINNQAAFDQKAPIDVFGKPSPSRAGDIKVENGMIYVPNNPPIKIKDKYPGMVDGLPKGIEEKDIVDLLYKFNYTIGFHGHYEKGWRNGTKVGGYFVNGRDGISRVVTYVADELGYRPKFRLINLGLESPDTPKEGTEKTFGLKNFEFVWYPLK